MLKKEHITEVKSYKKPTDEIAMVMYAVMVILGHDASWPTVQRVLADTQFVKKISEFDKEHISQKKLQNIEKYTKKDIFDPDIIGKKSQAAGVLCLWVRSMEDYSKALKIVRPKRQKLEVLETKLREKMAELKALEDEFAELQIKIKELETTLNSTLSDRDKLNKDVEVLFSKIDRGDKLITGLASEKERWI